MVGFLASGKRIYDGVLADGRAAAAQRICSPAQVALVCALTAVSLAGCYKRSVMPQSEGHVSTPAAKPAYTGGASLLAHSVLAEDASNWFDKNNWRSLVQYQVSPDCVMPSASCVGTVTVNGIPNQKAAVALNVVPPANQSVSAIYSMSMQQ